MKLFFFLVCFLFQYIYCYQSEPQCGYKSCNPVKEGYINIHFVPHTHDDVGWTKSVDQYYYGVNIGGSADGVQLILDSVVDSLRRDPRRRFIYVETAFFWKWWIKQNDEIKSTVKKFVDNGQLEFVGGGWSMNDEAVTGYQSIIDQMTWGLRKLNDTFGACGRPKVAWQIDPFGHSRETADIFKRIGFDAFFMSRIDFTDKKLRADSKELEFMWKTSDVLESKIFTSVFLKDYSSPNGLCFDVKCTDNPVIDDIESPEYNVDSKLSYLYYYVDQLVTSSKTNNVLVPMGGDFNYMNAEKWYISLDRLFGAVNAAQSNGSLYNAIYSTPSCYLKAVYEETNGRINASLKTDDFFPYASDQNSYWTGFYSSRPTLKRFERMGNNFLQICKQIASLSNITTEDEKKLDTLREAMGVMQHHDAVTGTETQMVARDYARLLQNGIASCEDLTISTLKKLAKTASENDQLYKDLPDLKFTTCPLTNLSECTVSEQEDSFVLTVYNPLGRIVKKFVTLPVNGTAYLIKDSEGKQLTSDLIPIPKSVKILPGRNSTATLELKFLAEDIPPLGYKTYFVQKISGNYVVSQDNSTSAVNSTLVGVALNPHTGFLSHIQVNGSYYEVNQSLWYYTGSLGGGSVVWRPSGAYVFRPEYNTNSSKLTNVTDKAEYYEIYQGKLVTEIHQYFSNWTSQIIRLYKDESFVEFNWLIGYPEMSIGTVEVTGKEYVNKFETKLRNSKTFYTDSNGRQTMKRVLNYRPTWNATIQEYESGNYYPVVSKICLRDEESNLEFAVLTDRAQGGSSLEEGAIELMIYRNCQKDDAFGVNEPLQETQFGASISVRGSHYVFIGPSGSTLNNIERDLELRTLFDSWMFLAPADGYTYESYKASRRMEYSVLNHALPNSVHLLTLEPWKNSSLLLRLEHLNEVSHEVSVDLKELFALFKVISLKETTLGGNQWLEDNELLNFVEDGGEEKSVEEESHLQFENEDVFNITLKATEIRTFVVEIKY